MFSDSIYESWKEMQFEKYKDIFPEIEKYLSNSFNVLDFGVGKAWFEEFLAERDFIFNKIVGFDVSEKAVSPKKGGIEYIIANKLEIPEKFNFIIAFDSLHLLKNPKEILNFARDETLILISEPIRFKGILENFSKFKTFAKGQIGEVEKDYFILIKNTLF